MTRHSLRLALCLTVSSVMVPWTMAAPPADAAARAEFGTLMRSLQGKVAELTSLRDTMAAEMPDVPRKSMDDGCLGMTLTGAADENELTVYCVRRNGAWIGGQAKAWEYSPIIAEVDASGLKVSGVELSGEVTVHLAAWKNKRRPGPMRGIPVPARYSIQAKAWGDRYKGTGQLANPNEAPHPAEPFAMTAVWYPAGKPVFAAAPKEVNTVNLLKSVVWQERRACELYREILAIELQRQWGVPFALGTNVTVDFRVDRDGVATRAVNAGTVQEEPDDPPSADDETTNVTAKAVEPAKPKAKPVVKKKAMEEPSMDDAGGPSIDVEVAGMEELSEGSGPEVGIVVKEAQKALTHIDRMIELVKACRPDDGVKAVQRANEAVPDPEFGPWSGSKWLPESNGVGILPDSIGAQGPNEWMHPTTWKILGVWPRLPLVRSIAALPDFVPAFDALSWIDVTNFPRSQCEGGYEGINPRGWEEVNADGVSGGVTFPVYLRFTAYPVYGHDWGMFYAASEVMSPKDCEVWAAIRCRNAASVRVNDRLVWESGLVEADPSESCVWTFKIPLKKGVNRLMARLETTQRTPWFSVHLCTRGGPRPAAEAAEAIARTEEIYKTLKSPYEGLRQYRNDHTGWFPGSNPPLAWDLVKNINVKWRTPTLKNNGAMLVQGDHVLVWAEPCTLICLDRRDGKERWRRHLDPLEVVDPAAHAQVKPLIAKAQGLQGEAATNVWKEVDTLYKKAIGFPYKEENDNNYSGDAMSTPISDGKHIWVRASVKALVCLTMDGEVKWKVANGGGGKAMGHPVSSPVMVGRKIVIQVPTWPGKGVDLSEFREALCDENAMRDEGHHKNRRQALRCYDADTGKLLWTSRKYKVPYYGNRYNADGIATPHVMRLTNGKDTTDVIFTSGGTVFRLDDGEIVLGDAGIADKSATPVDDGRGTFVLFSTEYSGHSGAWGNMIAMRLGLLDRDHVVARQLWRATVQGGCDLGGIRDDAGRVYQSEGGHLWVVDERNGRVLARQPDIFPYSPGHLYPPAAFAGGRLYLADDGRNGFNNVTSWVDRDKPESEKTPLLSSVVSVVLPNDSPFVLARNFGPVVNGTTMTPVPDGEDLFLRFRNEVVCFGRMDDAGKKYEAETVARTVIQQLQTTTPIDDKIPSARGKTGYLGYGVMRPNELEIGEILTDFAVLGTFPVATADEVGARLGFPTNDTWLGRANSEREGRKFLGFEKAISRSYTQDNRGVGRIHMGDGRLGIVYDLSKIHSHEPGTVSFWGMRKWVDRERVLRLDAPGGYFRVFIDGVEVPHNHRIRLPRGSHLVSCMGTYPKDAKGELGICPRFWPADKFEEEKAQRLENIKLLKPYLENAAKLVPETEPGKVAAALLAEVK